MTSTLNRPNRIHMLGDESWDPSNYEYEFEFDAYPEFGSGPRSEHEIWSINQLQQSATSTWDERHQCDHCGAHIRYVVALRHLPSGTLIAVGQDCATERFGEPDRISYLVKRAAQFRAAAKERAERNAALAAFGDAHPGVLDFFQEYGEAWEAGVRHHSDEFVMDVGRKLTKYASISDRQIEAVAKAFARDGEKERERFVREQNPQPTAPAPTGRVTISGKLIWEREYDGDYGTFTKVIILADEGYRVMITKPTGLGLAEIGDIVSVTATLEPDPADPTFAKGKRPSKAFVVRSEQ